MRYDRVRSVMNQLTGQSGLAIHATILVLALILMGRGKLACAQGVATGGTAVPARPLPTGMKAPTVSYEDLALQAGLTGVEVSGADHGKEYIVESTGTGVAIFDYDNDGLPDILLVNGGRLRGGAQPKPFLYHNLGGLKFEDVTEKAGITSTGWGQGVCAGDIDNDGNTDIFITQWGQNILYRNQGNGTFRDETKERGLLASKRWSTGCAFIDYNRDGHLDLVVVHYIDFDLAHTPRPGDKSQCQWKGLPVLCGPRGLPPETVSLYENDGHGHFTDVSDRVHITGPKDYYGFTALAGDFDNDGWPDIYIACDSTASLYYHNLGGKTFEEIGVRSGLAYNQDGREQAGMGATAADVTGSGLLDIFKTNFADDTHTFYRNRGKNDFEDDTIGAGLAVNTKYLGWGTAFLDFDNDGWKDLIVANGHVYPQVDHTTWGTTWAQRPLLFRNIDGKKFDLEPAVEGTALAALYVGRGMAVGDLFNDGKLDVVINALDPHPSLLRNVSADNHHWIELKLVGGTKSPRDAIGSTVYLTAGGQKQRGDVTSGGSFASTHDPRVHFGLGDAATIDSIEVHWPSGAKEKFIITKVDQIVN